MFDAFDGAGPDGDRWPGPIYLVVVQRHQNDVLIEHLIEHLIELDEGGGSQKIIIYIPKENSKTVIMDE